MKQVYIFVAFLLLIGCIEPFEPNIEEFESVYVVDGELNNLPGPYEVRLSQSFEYDVEEVNWVSGAQVFIIDDLGNEVELQEISDGHYRTQDMNFRGIPGRKYRLRVEVSEDVILVSDFEELKAPVPIDSLYWEYEDRPHLGVQGIEIMLDTRDPQNKSQYYAWEYEEYWQYAVAYIADPDSFPEPNYVCWDSSVVHSRILATTAGFTEDAIKRKSLYYIDNTSNRLERRYSTLLRQYVLSEEMYQFFKQIQSLNQNTGTLFDPIPYSIEGNMNYVGQPNTPVLGLFQVAGVSKKRMYVNSIDMPTGFTTQNEFENCMAISLKDIDTSVIDSVQTLGYTYFNKYVDEPRDTIPGVTPYIFIFASRRQCYLCTLTGTNKKPTFWKDSDE